MSKNPTDILIDVIALSQKLCVYPIRGNLAYATSENFLGRVVDGYNKDAADICLLSKQAAYALCNVQSDLNSQQQLGLYIYDAYRPLRSVRDFARWFSEPIASAYEVERKQIHYPKIEKKDLVTLGYTPDKISKHNYGTAVDLTLINLINFAPINMGACFDYFDEISHHSTSSSLIGDEAFNNRNKLAKIMQQHGFSPYIKEFWHYDFQIRETDEPMDIQIEKSLKYLNII